MVDQLLFPIQELILVSAVSAQKYVSTRMTIASNVDSFFALSLGGLKIKWKWWGKLFGARSKGSLNQTLATNEKK
jgi:hypothetical protein